MNAPRLLDLFCGAGGAAMGYHRAGFDVTGVDISPQPRYPFKFIQADAMTFPLDGFDLIHASPPCQLYSTSAQPGRKLAGHPDLLGPVRDRLKASGRPYVIENVVGAPMPTAILLCGVTFGLPLVRHRLFECSHELGLAPSLCPQRSRLRATAHPGCYPYGHGNWHANWNHIVRPRVWPWMTADESGQAIPPAYTEWIGACFLDIIAMTTESE